MYVSKLKTISKIFKVAPLEKFLERSMFTRPHLALWAIWIW